jgi:hypothetical protein
MVNNFVWHYLLFKVYLIHMVFKSYISSAPADN